MKIHLSWYDDQRDGIQLFITGLKFENLLELSTTTVAFFSMAPPGGGGDAWYVVSMRG